MDKQKIKIKSDNGNSRNSSEFFTVRLDNEQYILTKEVLVANVNEKVLRMKRWYFPNLKFLSFKESCLELKCDHQKISHVLKIRIEKDKFHVSCSCNEKVEKLCFHAFKAFDRLILFEETKYFQQFKPNGLFDLAHSHKKLFRRDEKGLNINPKPGLGVIYLLENDLNVKQLVEVLRIPVNQEIKPSPFPNDTALTYIIVQSCKSRLLPFLVPCIGKLNKSRDFIKGFSGFISGAQKEYDKYLNREQRILNKLCYNAWRIVENGTGQIVKEDNGPKEMQDIQTVFEFWQSIFPILQLQPFLHLYFMYWKKELKKRPSKSRIQTIRLGTDEPQLRFRLIDKGVFYHFDLRVFVKNKEIKGYMASPTFFIQDYDSDTVYLMGSLRDAAIVEWMKILKNKVTIFKEHYTEFENNVLKQLQQSYTIDKV